MKRAQTNAVMVGDVQIGGGAPVVVQAMTSTETSDAVATSAQCLELAQAGAELLRITVNTPEAAEAVPEIRRRLDDAGCDVPLIGDFHFNGHVLLTRHPDCARVLDKYRINPGNLGKGERHDENFEAICTLARHHGKAIRIGVNGGSLDQDLVTEKMRENAERGVELNSDEVFGQCMVISAVESIRRALEHGLGDDQIVVSCKVSNPPDLITIYRSLAEKTDQPLHLGLTEAGLGVKGLVWSAAAMGVLLSEGIGDTIRMSLTPTPGGNRCQEVYAACELLQALGIRIFSPTITACPGCGRTTSTTFQELAARLEQHVRDNLSAWREVYNGVENLRLAVMGCVVNGPGESRNADIGISLPGTGEAPRCPVFVEGEPFTTLEGDSDRLATQFIQIIEDYVRVRYPKKSD